MIKEIKAKSVKLPLLADQISEQLPDLFWYEWDPRLGMVKMTNLVVARNEEGVPFVKWNENIATEEEMEAIIEAHESSSESVRETLEREKREHGNSGRTKLKGLGLTDAEVEALVG
jgi:hypothetical protein